MVEDETLIDGARATPGTREPIRVEDPLSVTATVCVPTRATTPGFCETVRFVVVRRATLDVAFLAPRDVATAPDEREAPTVVAPDGKTREVPREDTSVSA